MDNVSFGSWNREGRDYAKKDLVQYTLHMAYGREYYTPDEIQTMFTELDALGMLFPKSGETTELLDAYVAFRELYHATWFDRWFNKPRRNINNIKPTDV